MEHSLTQVPAYKLLMIKKNTASSHWNGENCIGHREQMNGNNKIIAVCVKPVISSYREVVSWRAKKKVYQYTHTETLDLNLCPKLGESQMYVITQQCH